MIETEGQAGLRSRPPVIIGVEAKAAMVAAQQRRLGLGTRDIRVPHQRAIGEDPHRPGAVAQCRDVGRHRIGGGEFGCWIEHLVSVALRPLAATGRGHYNLTPTMRRPTRLGLAVTAVLLVLLGAYTAGFPHVPISRTRPATAASTAPAPVRIVAKRSGVEPGTPSGVL